MASTVFVNGSTLTDAAWFNDINTVAYTLFGNGSAYTGALTLGSSGNIAVNTNKFTVTASSGNTLIAGTLALTGAATFSSTLAAGATTITGTLNASGIIRADIVASNTNALIGSASGGNIQIGLNGSAAVIYSTSGQLKLQVANDGTANQGDILWGKPLVAIGSTSTCTLGKTGGSGPATSTQDSWMRVVDSTGAAFWVPAWK